MRQLKLFIILFAIFGFLIFLTTILDNIIFNIALAILFSIIITCVVNKIYKIAINNIKYYTNCINKNDLMININDGKKGIGKEIISEIGKMLEEMKKNFKKQVNIATKLSEISEQINQISIETQTAMESIASSAEITSKNSESQFKMMEQVSKKIDDIVVIFNNIKKEMEDTVEFTSKSIESAREGIKSTREVQEKIKITKQLANKNAKKVDNLMVYSEKVVKLIDLINSVSNQTNMLSLNASIEAARAGEYGKGFSVVAMEVSKLANETSKVSAEIEEVISNLRNDIKVIYKSMYQESTQVDECHSEMQKTIDGFSKIEESLMTSATKIENVNISINKATESVNEIQSSVDEVTDFTSQISSQMQETTTQVMVQNEKISKLHDIINDLYKTSDNMQQYVTSKVMEGKMLRDVTYIQNRVGNKAITEDLMQELLRETGVDTIYLTNENGVVKYSNEKKSIGLNLYQLDKCYLLLKNREKTYVTTPLKKRVEDGRLFKFLAAVDKNGIIYQVGLSIESLLKF